MDVSKVRSWVRQFNEGRTSCDNKPKQPRACTSRSDDMIEKVERLVLGDRRMTVEQIASSVGISVGSVHTILHDDQKMRKVSSRWVPRMLTDDHKAARVACCQAMLTRNDSMNGTFFLSIVTMDETWMPFFNPEPKRQSAQWKHTDSPPPKKFRVTASAEKNDGVHVLGQRGRNPYPLRSKGLYGNRCIVRKCFEEQVPSCTATKTSGKGCACAVSPRQRTRTSN
ncbi:protein GVQW3-like [Anabrus simplex]|uniref:protein GVQW3-like n=1 Tax=Anabrus simplex TaxID=316456 RepID=UPI0035A2F3DF